MKAWQLVLVVFAAFFVLGIVAGSRAKLDESFQDKPEPSAWDRLQSFLHDPFDPGGCGCQ